MTRKLDPDRPNKARLGRPKKLSPHVKATKAKWLIPWFRAYMSEKNAIKRANQNADRLANPNKYTRTGTPDGMTRATAAPLWAAARLKADRFMKKMADEGTIPTIVIPDSDEAKGIAALDAAVLLALGPTDKQIKMAAIRTVLEYTRSKPESKSKVTLTTSEQWLAEITAEDAAD